jgi:hypothetical protein
MVSLDNYALYTTHDICVLHYYVGLGIFPWDYIKRRIQYGPWENEIK